MRTLDIARKSVNCVILGVLTPVHKLPLPKADVELLPWPALRRQRSSCVHVNIGTVYIDPAKMLHHQSLLRARHLHFTCSLNSRSQASKPSPWHCWYSSVWQNRSLTCKVGRALSHCGCFRSHEAKPSKTVSRFPARSIRKGLACVDWLRDNLGQPRSGVNCIRKHLCTSSGPHLSDNQTAERLEFENGLATHGSQLRVQSVWAPQQGSSLPQKTGPEAMNSHRTAYCDQ